MGGFLKLYLNHSTRETADEVESKGHEALTPFCQRGLHHMYRQHMNELLCTMSQGTVVPCI